LHQNVDEGYECEGKRCCSEPLGELGNGSARATYFVPIESEKKTNDEDPVSEIGTPFDKGRCILITEKRP